MLELDLLVAYGINETTANTIAAFLDAGLGIASFLTLITGAGLTLKALQIALRAGGKKAVVA
ncbi:MAG: hypothetical protein C6W58_13840 [Bacillaceae bacterium]|jgi:hypothetical protein|uniref:Uncharacterized protein n=2 Tax=Aeribacillus TaxID=1055323 RepID=A0A164AEE1_9BACI|nr:MULTISPECIES: hypothetical protein [Aeribacillus]REJ13876.1 MAG: hypothetical protein C6W58_13840 [Bacillaceae bacterium]KZM56104.1 hypothetical protein A3Q35_09580 [Aeribacillus pallidus]KZN95928.1 hypothetical protein AZI98_11290 [Aeribacillus pallidus]MDR9797146.1 hypothetical protein [Aeribacillus pallidus]MED0651558.1 hypothetical protein [Aeribacillus composti]